MARWPQKQQQQEVSVAPARVDSPAPPAFDKQRRYDDACEGQLKYWVQNGWLYKRGSGEPVREVGK